MLTYHASIQSIMLVIILIFVLSEWLSSRYPLLAIPLRSWLSPSWSGCTAFMFGNPISACPGNVIFIEKPAYPLIAPGITPLNAICAWQANCRTPVCNVDLPCKAVLLLQLQSGTPVVQRIEVSWLFARLIELWYLLS